MQRHKIMAVIGLILIIFAGYFGQKAFGKQAVSVRYVTAAIEEGMLISSITGTGQVSASNLVDLKSKVSGEVIEVKVKSGQEVKTDEILAQVDSRDALKAVRDAQTDLETAQLELNKLLASAEELDILQAENALTIAKNNLEELINPSPSTLSQAENALISVQDSLTKLKFSQNSSLKDALDTKKKAQDNFIETYENAFNNIADAFLDLPALITDLKNILYGQEICNSELSVGSNIWNIQALKVSISIYDNNELDELNAFIRKAENNYEAARESYDNNFEDYKEASRYSERAVIEELLAKTVETVRLMAETVKSEVNMLDYWIDYRSEKNLSIFNQVSQFQSNLKTYTATTNSNLSNLLSEQRTLKDDKQAILDSERSLTEIKQNQPLDLAEAERNVQEKKDALEKLKNPDQDDIDAAKIDVKEKELTLKDLKDGADELDIRAKRIAINQKNDALLSVRQTLADYNIIAPFDGQIASLDISKGDSINSGTVVGSLMTTQKIAEITLNEIDVASVKVGQKVTLTFDAISDLSVTGEVVEIDTLGTVNQGIVSYDIKIAFDVQDDRIKSGMSVSVAIITASKQDVLLAPIGAVKTQNNASYVEVLINNQPQRKIVTTGLSNDTMIEITDGLETGENVITQTINSDATSQTNTSNQNNQTGSGGFGGEFRMLR